MRTIFPTATSTDDAGDTDVPDSPLTVLWEPPLVVATLNRPGVHNAVDGALMGALETFLDDLERRGDIRVVILTGAGGETFCAGGDLRWFATLTSREACLAMSRRMQAILARLYGGPRPVIAAINGQALGGGCEILTACHLRLAATHARFAFRQAPNGILTGWGGGGRLFAQLRRGDALRMVLSGDPIYAQEALRIGLVDKLVHAEELMTAARELGVTIAGHSRDAVAAFLEMSRRSVGDDPASLAAWETETFGNLWMGPEFQAVLERFR